MFGVFDDHIIHAHAALLDEAAGVTVALGGAKFGHEDGECFGGSRNIDLKNSWMVGDRAKDIEAGKAAGCKTCLIEYGYIYPCNPDLTCKNVLKFAEKLIINVNQR